MADQCPSQTSGLLTADTAVYARPCRLMAIWLNPAAATSSVVCYDNASAASGTVVGKAAAVANGQDRFISFGPNGVDCTKGIYADITGASAEMIIYFSPL